MSGQEILRDARRAAGLTQRRLAERTGVAQPTIARIESGSSDPRLSTLQQLLAACDLELVVRPAPGYGVDRSQMRELLRLSPTARLRLLTDDVAGLTRLEGAVRR